MRIWLKSSEPGFGCHWLRQCRSVTRVGSLRSTIAMQDWSRIKRLGRRLLRPRISLRGLLILVALVSLAFFGVASVRQAHENDREAQEVLSSRMGFSFRTESILPIWVCRFVGYDAIAWFERASEAYAPVWHRSAEWYRDRGDANFTPEDFACFSRIADCRHLRFLSLHDISLGDQEVRVISQLRRLEHLHLDSLDFQANALARFRELPNLRAIGIHNCPVEPMSLVELSRFKKLRLLTLEALDLDLSRLQHIDVSELEVLSLNSSLVDDSISQLLSRCAKLETLSLNGCNISDRTLAQLKHCRLLRTLHLDDTEIVGRAFEDLRDLDLRILSLTGSQLDDTGAAALAQVHELEFLDISETNVTVLGLSHLARMPQLRDLTANGVELQPTELGRIKFAAPLTGLSLNDTGIDDRDVEALLATSQPLFWLQIRNCPISASGIARLRSRHRTVYDRH